LLELGRSVSDRPQFVFEPDPVPSAKTRVFLCYSRKDGSFTSRLADKLYDRGFRPDFDQSAFDPTNIDSGVSAQDDWWQRLRQMIEAADVIVFVVSPDSAASKVCDDEIAHARKLGKRIVPILHRSVNFAKAPPRLAALNVKINFAEDAGATFDGALDQLCAELDLDVSWHRECRRIIQLAARWRAEGRSVDLLMNPTDIGTSERLLQSRPRNADPPARLLIDFLAASRDAQKKRLRKEEQQVARTLRFQENAWLASNKLADEAERFHQREGIRVASTAEMLQTAACVVDVDEVSEGIAADPRLEPYLGRVLAQLSRERRLLNELGQAERDAQRAIGIFARLSKTDPDNEQYLEDLHATIDRLVDASDNPEAAIRAADCALDLAKALVKKNPTLERRSQLAVSLSKCAHLIKSYDKSPAIDMFTEGLRIILRHESNIDGALAEYRQSLALTERLSGIDDSNIDLRLTLMRLYDRVADTVACLGYADQAIESYTKGFRTGLAIARESPDRSDWPGTRSLLDSLAMALIRNHKPESAYECVTETLTIIRDAVRRTRKFKDDLAKVLGFQSYVAQFTSNIQVALNASAEAVALSPKNWQIGVNRVHALLRAGDSDGAAQHYNTICKDDSDEARKFLAELERDSKIFEFCNIPENFLSSLVNFIGKNRFERASRGQDTGQKSLD
jgi:tetratricopeptide (TPR) repeat protein